MCICVRDIRVYVSARTRVHVRVRVRARARVPCPCICARVRCVAFVSAYASMVDKRVRLAVRHPWRPMKAIIRCPMRGGLVTGRRSAVGKKLSDVGLILPHCSASLLSRSLLKIIVDKALRCSTI